MKPNLGIAVNPFLPLNVYIPDGEPHVFGDRVYLFGSHDQEGGDTFCLLDYEFYSAPVDDLSDWTSKGVNYSAKQDPAYVPETRCSLYAPDVVRGNDGRYYLYYCLSGARGQGGYSNSISVAVADEPDGKYEYHGVVRGQDGKPFMKYVCFDPGVLNDNGRIWLYYGTCYPFDEMRDPISKRFSAFIQSKIFGRPAREIRKNPEGIMGAIAVSLADDMLTVISEARRIIPTRTKKTEFDGHAFFEGSSMRRIGDRYYFVYSSWLNHELCYAVSEKPDRDFRYGGTIVSTGDIGLNGRQARDRLNHTGTTHGSIENINGQWYVFYHRLTHGTGYSRQACAEKITLSPDGSIQQVPVTSCGLNPAALPAEGEYSAAIACVLTDGQMPHTSNSVSPKPHPMITHDGDEHLIADIRANTLIGFRSFAFCGTQKLTLMVKSSAAGSFAVSTELDGPVIGSIPVNAASSWTACIAEISFPHGTADLYLRYRGDGVVALLSCLFG